MMIPGKPGTWLAVATMTTALVGCASAPSASGPAVIQADAGGIPQVSALYEKATKQRVHRFRKPLRDARARARRQLAAECERLAADVKTWESSANLTAVGEAERSAVGTDIAALRASLDALGGAARNGRNASMQSAYAQAVNAYGRIRSKIDFTAQ